jgi:hypothetical protein
VNEAARATARTMPASKVSQRLSASNYVEVYSYSKAWSCLFPQHGTGPKHERQIALRATSSATHAIFSTSTTPRTVYVSRKHDVDRLDRFIGPKR